MDVACKAVADAVALVTADACAAAYATIEAAHVQANAARFAGRLALAGGTFAIVAAGVAYGGTLVQSSRQEAARVRQRDEEAAALRAAFLAEMEALNAIIAQRGWVTMLEQTVQLLRQGHDILIQVPTFHDDGMVPWPVFAASVSKVGLLDTQAAEAVTRYYGTVRSIRASWAFVERGGATTLTPEQRATFIEGDLSLYRQAWAGVVLMRENTPPAPKPSRSLWSRLCGHLCGQPHLTPA